MCEDEMRDALDRIGCQVERLTEAIVGSPDGQHLGIIGRVSMLDQRVDTVAGEISGHKEDCKSKAARQHTAFYAAITAISVTVWRWIADHK